MSTQLGCIVNIISFSHPHARSLYKEGLWGFPDNRVNRARWDALIAGCEVLFYGGLALGDGERKGVYVRGILRRKWVSGEPVDYWVQNPRGYPLQISVELLPPKDPKLAKPITKEELAGAFGVEIFRQRMDRWSLVVFGERGRRGVTYSFDKFAKLAAEFAVRNRQLKLPERPEHEEIKEVIYQMGLLQQRISLKEVELDGYKLDVAWKRLPKSDPYIVFEVQIGGNLNDALTKLKHARDIWNSRPVLVTTEDQLPRAKEIVSGAFHEIKDELRILDWSRLMEAYKAKSHCKELESSLGIS